MEYHDCCEAIFEQNEDSSLVKITLNQNVFFPRGQSEIYFRNGKIIKVHELVLEHYSENEKGVTEYFLKDEVTLFDINKIAIVNTKKIKGDKLTSGDGDELTDKKLIEKLNSLTPERALHGTGDYEYFESAIQRVFLDKK